MYLKLYGCEGVMEDQDKIFEMELDVMFADEDEQFDDEVGEQLKRIFGED